MFRTFSKLSGADSPFRYARAVKVSPLIRSKDFGRDVVMFANPAKLRLLAVETLQGSHEKPDKAFWEIFAKRVNETVHLLDGETLIDILTCFDKVSERPSLMAGLCHFICQDLERSQDITAKFKSLKHVLEVTSYLDSYSVKLSRRLYENLISAISDLTFQIDEPKDAFDVAAVVSKIRVKGQPLSPAESVLLKRLVAHASLGEEVVGSFDDFISKLASS